MAKNKPIVFEVTGSGCFLVTSHKPLKTGYIQKSIHGRLQYVHRLAYEEMFGPIPEGLSVLHSCDQPSCINPEHLRTGTQQENMQDRQDRNRQARGSKMNTAVLMEMEVVRIAQMLVNFSDTELGKLYNVTSQNISAIRHGKSWSHITGIPKK